MYFESNRVLYLGLHGAISQKIAVFITTALRTSDPTILLYEEYGWLRHYDIRLKIAFSVPVRS
jgi:hypothetical protein